MEGVSVLALPVNWFRGGGGRDVRGRSVTGSANWSKKV